MTTDEIAALAEIKSDLEFIRERCEVLVAERDTLRQQLAAVERAERAEAMAASALKTCKQSQEGWSEALARAEAAEAMVAGLRAALEMATKGVN